MLQRINLTYPKRKEWLVPLFSYFFDNKKQFSLYFLTFSLFYHPYCIRHSLLYNNSQNCRKSLVITSSNVQDNQHLCFHGVIKTKHFQQQATNDFQVRHRVDLSLLVTASLSFQITISSKHHFNDIRLEKGPVQFDSCALYLSSVKAHFKAACLCSHEAP